MTFLDQAISDQPEYSLFRRAFAERKAPLVIMCGSGLSAPAGLPTWPSLRKIIEQEAQKKVSALNKFGDEFIGPKLQTAKRQPDLWVAFKLLKEILTKPVFENLIELHLSPPDAAEIPPSYLELLKLDPRGLITLNLDKFAGEALASVKPGLPVTPIYGKEIAQKWRQIQASKTFLVYLHGALHDPGTWVLTQDDLEDIQSQEGQSHFLKTVFTENLVLFVGMSADDVALSKRLLELTTGGFSPINLYWLTTRLDAATDQWAAAANVSLIRYAAPSEAAHAVVIKNIVEDCLKYKSVDPVEPPLVSEPSKVRAVLVGPVDPAALAQEQPEYIRQTLTAILDERLSTVPEEKLYATYRAFCEEYDYPVHRAFYKSKAEPFNNWFGYKLEYPALGRGNFGEVFSARDQLGNLVAVKVMHENIFGNDEMLGGFRRGVRSMEIVTEQNIPGMVPIIERYELPPTIIMPFIEGYSLEDTLKIRKDLPWAIRLSIARKIGTIVSAGHALPQTVLHRDIKPSNIMVRNMEFKGAFDPEVVVLDFDMSWHKGSNERDIVFESRDDFGYLAPEQTDAGNRYTARSTRVDSYGFGMTLFFMFGLEPPRPNEGLSENWFNRALKACQRGYDEHWKSGPRRMARLITRASAIDQNDRADFATIVRELGYLERAIVNTAELDNAELWAEEILANLELGASYDWDDAVGRGSVNTPSGLTVEMSANFRNNSAELRITYIDKGMRDRASLSKYLKGAVNTAEKTLIDGGWLAIEKRVNPADSLLRMSYDLGRIYATRQTVMSSAYNAIKVFYFQ